LQPLYVHAVTSFRRGNYRVTRWVDAEAHCCDACFGKALWLPWERGLYWLLLLPIGVVGGIFGSLVLGGLGFFFGAIGGVIGGGIILGRVMHSTYGKVLGKRAYGKLCAAVGVSGWGIMNPISFARYPKWGHGQTL
jgi:hypothetical protein